ncbi:NADH-quinone oxidoreductase subunit N [Streptomyces sp. TRM75563]|uniref:NADH-quinone oxidoreductase subunit N n=1 Tax=Streptomyces sp. TRM75563 TaxID=2817418 RepID=UPI001F606D07|nr:NADH-quinone oxidoreductase subunit N [Streptomyces sp. TRM75563]MCI4042430.1 NADH-quinone oxidoreductase subunit N [Streptomyces sp. TRM75563]
MTEMNENPFDILPEIFLVAGAVLGLLLGAWLPRHRQWITGVLAAIACTAGIIATAVTSPGAAASAFGDAFALDPLTSAGRIIILSGGLIVLALSLRPLHADPREAEFYVLIQLALLGAMVLAGAQDLLLLAAGYLLASIPAYTLAGFRKDGPGTEAALKYYAVGALLGVVILAGATVLYATGRATSYLILSGALDEAPQGLLAVGTLGLLAGLLFKAGAVPAHYWIPDTVQGSAPPAAALIATLPKIGALTALFRLGVVPLDAEPLPWAALLAVLAAASMTLGNLAAFFQSDVKRLLAYSTISQVGYLLMPVAVASATGQAQPALLYYLGAYTVTNLGAFAVVCALPGAARIDDYRGLARRRPLLTASLVVCLLGLLGTPPTAVFVGKLEVFTATVDGGYTWLAVLAAVNTVASLFYYLRWIMPALTPGGRPAPPCRESRTARAVAYTCSFLSLAMGVAAGPLLGLLSGPISR